MGLGLNFSQWSSNYSDSDQPIGFPTYHSKVKSNYFEIPLYFGYKFGQRELKYVALIESAYSFLVGTNELISEDYANFYLISKNKTTSFNPPISCVRVGFSFGFEYEFVNSFSIRASPQFKYLWNLNNRNLLINNTWSVGLNCSLIKSL